MKMRLAWLADSEWADSYSAREARILLPAIAREPGVVPLWFAVGSPHPPRLWNGVRIFPVPEGSLASPAFLRTLIVQQQPDVLLSDLPYVGMLPAADALAGQRLRWVHRINPEDRLSRLCPAGATFLTGDVGPGAGQNHSLVVPYIRGLDPACPAAANPTIVLDRLLEALTGLAATPAHGAARNGTALVMRQHLFCNTSLATVMFELTNALLELGVPAVPQDEHPVFSREHVHREEELYRSGAPGKYQRVLRHVNDHYDPEHAITVHFTVLGSSPHVSLGAFPCLAGREVLYTTGNHTVSGGALGGLMDMFRMILAPSAHVLEPYFMAGLPRERGAIIPHGIDPAVFAPEEKAFRYPTRKSFKFLQTSFPWVEDKGFDLTIKAFCSVFTDRDDVALVLRVPTVADAAFRQRTYGQLHRLVDAAAARRGAPEILLLEEDVEPCARASYYLGANCYVHPARAEGFGMTILEAMACGLPVISTPWSGPADFLSPAWAYALRHSAPVPERFHDGSILRYFVRPELDHLVALMRHVYQHQDEARALGREAARVARQRWTWQHAARKLASLFSLDADVSTLGGNQDGRT